MRRVEIRDPINAEHHHLAGQSRTADADFSVPPQQSTGTDRSSCHRPGDQPHAVAIPLDADAGAVFWPMSDMPF